MKNYHNEVQKNIKRYRELKGYNIMVLSTLTGISSEIINQIENGDQEITIQMLEKIANALKINITLFFGNDALEEIKENVKQEKEEERFHIYQNVHPDLDKTLPVYFAKHSKNKIVTIGIYRDGSIRHTVILKDQIKLIPKQSIFAINLNEAIHKWQRGQNYKKQLLVAVERDIYIDKEKLRR